MKATRLMVALAACTLMASLAASVPLAAEEKKEEPKKEESKPAKTVDCEMKFNLKGWSAFYKTSKGEGTITCNNGQTASVDVKATGGGITFGTEEIADGTGRFSKVNDISELLGSYAQSEAHAGAGKGAGASAMTKGDVQLTLAGTGKGVSVGFAFGKFTITKKGAEKKD
jgi:hypothetical protein